MAAVPNDISVQLCIIASITVIATVSVVSGVGKGIKILSELNLGIALLLLLFVFATGPTLFILRGFIQNIGDYVQHLPALTLWAHAYRSPKWQSSWTIFYWGWWIAWSPFVGMFIARISRGRTIREFIIGVLLVPTLVTFVWLAVFGNAALFIELRGAGGISEAVAESVPKALYATLAHFPASTLTSILATLVIITFFVTSSDSGSLVIDVITAGGMPIPPFLNECFGVFWKVRWPPYYWSQVACAHYS
ncbi:MAG: BCCT family transporter [Myxococcota bacterium]